MENDEVDGGRPLIALVEADPESVARIGPELTERRWRWRSYTLGHALDRLDADVVLVDAGIAGAEAIHSLSRNAPLLVVSADASETSKVAAFEAGAQDYVTKPFGVKELAARIGVLLQRKAGAARTRPPALSIDLDAARVFRDGAEVVLPPRERDLVVCLARARGEAVPTARILLTVWMSARTKRTHYVHVYVARVRAKLEPDPSRPRFLLTVPSVGYRLQGVKIL